MADTTFQTWEKVVQIPKNSFKNQYHIKKVKLKVNWLNMFECVHKIRLILTTARACDIQTVAFYEEK